MARPRSLVLCLCLPVFLSTTLLSAAEPFRYVEGKYGKGELKYTNGLPVLTVAGTPEEIGAQVGALTAKPLQRLVNYAPALARSQGFEKMWPQILKASAAMAARFPPDHLAELESLIKHAGVDHDLAVACNTLPDIKKLGGCATLIVEAERSATHRPLFGRNLDYPTLGFLQEYTLVTVYHPTGKHAFVSIGFPGLIGCVSGINDAGLALATLEVNSANDGSPAFDPKGTPYLLALRRVLEECTTLAEAEKLLRSLKRTTMNNLAICDRNGGAVFEMTPRNLVVRRSTEGICPCTNHFRTKELATSTECRRYEALEKCRALPRIGLADVARSLDAANQGELTLETMIFEPADLKLQLAIGKCPSSALPLKELALAPFFRKGGAKD